MKQHKHVWTWPIAGYLFLGGLGAAMVIIAALADLLFGLAFLFVPCATGSLVALGLGSFLLIFELGRPMQFWRVFSKQRAVLTFGAWMVIALIVFDVIYFSFWFSWVPWSGVAALRMVIALVCLLLGCGVLLYTGIELSSMKARVFWNTPALPILFALSGLLVGAAADYLMLIFWPYLTWSDIGSSALASLVAALEASLSALFLLTLLLSVLTLVGVFTYVLLMYTSSTGGAKKPAARWLNGSYTPAFWGGLVVVGLVLPLVLLLSGLIVTYPLAMLCFIIGGVFLRFLVVYNDDRRMLKGEELFWKRLPQGNEPFLKSNW